MDFWCGGKKGGADGNHHLILAVLCMGILGFSNDKKITWHFGRFWGTSHVDICASRGFQR